MNPGILDLPGLALGPLDHLLELAHAPGLLRVFGWGALVGYIGMWIYRRWSPQQRIAELRIELADVQKRLAAYDGEFSGLLPLIRGQFALALRQMRLTAGAALLAALPILLVLPWLSNQYGVHDPLPGTAIRICVEPADVATSLHWSSHATPTDSAACNTVSWPANGETTTLTEGATRLLQLPLPAPAEIVHKRHWLNTLVGNPAGYLADASAAARVHLDLPAIELIGWGPKWLRGWEAAFFLSALIVSLWLRWRWKLN
ncbi:MAG: hypothetical protein WAS23_11550 [Dokdonella sp.]|uniref:hypothetical protein n=1 Tax=Dokdonella sp. TaxID=2291710 RepID=UPI003BAE44EB